MRCLRIAISVFALGTATVQAQDLGDVVATVNGHDITVAELLIARSNLPAQYQQIPAEQLFEGVLNQLIQQQLLSDTLTEEPARLQAAIKTETRALRAGEVLTSVADGAVTEEAVQRVYDADFLAAAKSHEYNAAHILLETEDEAKDMIAQLEAGAEFADLAREHSTGPSGPDGGDLGWFGKGVMVPEFEEAVVGLEVGAVSAPVKTQFGWHVVKLNDIRDQAAPELDAVRAEIENTLRTQAITDHLKDLEAKSDVTRTEGIDPAIIGQTDLLGSK